MNATDPLDFLRTLDTVIEGRRTAAADDSYTASLFASGPARIAQKVGEEGVELALASVTGGRPEILSEAADLLYHMLVLLKYHDLGIDQLASELAARHRQNR